jgi:cytochrome c oxidase subunit 2
MDAIPGRYTQLWFNATKPGTYHLFCAEYCGTKHSGMRGQVVVMPQNEYQAWLSGGAAEGTLAQQGEALFTDLACFTCHSEGSGQRGPVLTGVFGSQVELANGERVTANAEYIRESILNPAAKIVAGFPPIMPTFQGQVSEEQLLALTEYIKTLSGDRAPAEGGGEGGATPATPGTATPPAGGTSGSQQSAQPQEAHPH